MNNFSYITRVIVILGIGSFVNTSFAQTPDPVCSDLVGAAYGLCLAAKSIGCDGSDKDSKGCDIIEVRYTEITGTEPEWTLPPCPCGSTVDFIDHVKLNSDGINISCLLETAESSGTQILSINTLRSDDRLVFSFLPSSEKAPKRTCGFDNNSLKDIDSFEAQSCVNNIEETAAVFNITCN